MRWSSFSAPWRLERIRRSVSRRVSSRSRIASSSCDLISVIKVIRGIPVILPPSTCQCRWKIVCPPPGPTFTTHTIVLEADLSSGVRDELEHPLRLVRRERLDVAERVDVPLGQDEQVCLRLGVDVVDGGEAVRLRDVVALARRVCRTGNQAASARIPSLRDRPRAHPYELADGRLHEPRRVVGAVAAARPVDQHHVVGADLRVPASAAGLVRERAQARAPLLLHLWWHDVLRRRPRARDAASTGRRGAS